MADGILTDPKKEIAQLEAQIAALQSGQSAPVTGGPPGLLASTPAQPGAFSGPQGSDQMRQMYGLLAQYGDNPEQIGNQYVQAQQQQQRLDQPDNYAGRALYNQGPVNPGQYTVDSYSNYMQELQTSGDRAKAHGKLVRHDPLSSPEQGFLNESITKAQEQQQRANRMGANARDFAKSGIMAQGVIGDAHEFLKRTFGGEDEVSRIRTEYEQLRTSSVINNLPQGVASDKDVEIVMRGWPKGTADPQYLASFLRGMQKIAVVEEAAATHAAEYLSQNRNQIGQLENWNQNKDWRIERALKNHGVDLVYDDEPLSGGMSTPTPPAKRSGRGIGGSKKYTDEQIQTVLDLY